MNTDIDYTSKTLALGDIKQRLEYLQQQHRYGQPEEDAPNETWDGWREYEILRDLVDELRWCDDSTTLINIDHWVEYCQDLCYDIGDVAKGSIVDNLVDWDKVANSMLQDYKPVSLPEDNDFYVRG